jgi:hypothetical protein
MIIRRTFVVIACLAVGLAGCQSRPSTAPAAKGVYSRQEFRDLVTGKTPDEVLAAVGKPDATTEVPGQTNWTYNKRTKDPVTGKMDLFAVVVFRDGTVYDVLFG